MKRGSIRGVLVIAYVVVMCASLIVGLGLYQAITVSNRAATAYVRKLQDTKSLEYMLNLAVEKTADNSLALVLDKRLNNILSNNALLSDDELAKTVDAWLINNREVSSVHIVNLRKELLTRGRVSGSSCDPEAFVGQFSKETLAKIDEKAGDPYYGIADSLLQSGAAEQLFMARRINSLEKLNKIGYLFIFFDSEVLTEKIFPYVESRSMQAALVDGNNHFINLYKGAVLGEMYEAHKEDRMTEEKKKQWEADFHHVELDNDRLGLRLITDERYQASDNNMINIVIAILIINLVFLTVGTLAVRKSMIDPLERIAYKTKRITEQADLSIRFEEKDTYAEAGMIVQALNEMLERIDTLIKENQEKERQRRVLELSVVNHQVNPHFLFNTLNSVNVLIAMEDKKTALKLVASLAKYYRACLNQEETINTIEQELKVTQEYINIMKLKNPGLIQADFQVEEALYGCKVPGMVLQTLVENCIKYGIRSMDEPLKIDIAIQKDQEKPRLMIVVRDNGKGMEEEVIRKLLQEEKLKGKSGFGLRGTIKRIRLMYDIKDISQILKISSKKDQFTEITIFIPLS